MTHRRTATSTEDGYVRRVWAEADRTFKAPRGTRRHRRPLLFRALDHIGLLKPVLGLVALVTLTLVPPR